MRRQRNVAQKKEKSKVPENELNKTEMTNQSDAEFKTLVIRMLKELIETRLVWFSGLSSSLQTKGSPVQSPNGHMPGLLARFPVGGMQQATTH